MGRLENLQPQLKPGHFKQEGETFIFTADDGTRSQPVTPILHSFLEHCRGSYSIKEICMVVYNRHNVFSFTDVHGGLELWAKQGLFKDSQAVLDALVTAKPVEKSFTVNKTMSKDELAVHLRKVSLFSNLPVETIKAIVDASEQKLYKSTEIIIKRDTLGENAFVLLNGSVGVFGAYYLGKSEPIAVLPPLSVFGESAAVTNKKRNADVVAIADSLVLVMNLKKVVEPKDKPELNKNLRLRLVFNQLMRLHPVFKNLPSEVLQMLLGFCQVEQVPAHKTVVQQGDTGRQFYFILAGAVHVIKDRLPEVRLTVGSFFGEMGVLRRQTRSASIVTETECTFLTLSEKNFITLLSSNLRLGMEIEREIAIRGTTVPLPEVVAADDPEITEEITQKLDDIRDFDFSSQSGVEE
jgi:CRP-like cAMP-binding protein